VVSDNLGKSARAMLEALITGERDPEILAAAGTGLDARQENTPG
jgi:hypothetical protein